MSTASTIRPQATASRTNNTLGNDGITYNQSGLTYNEVGYVYGGADRKSSEPPKSYSSDIK